MFERFKGKSLGTKQDGAGVTETFNLNTVHEACTQDVLRDWHGRDKHRLARQLAVAQSRNQDDMAISLGSSSEIGDISGTQAFARFREKMLSSFPDVKDVRFKEKTVNYSDGPISTACIVFWLKTPNFPAQTNKNSGDANFVSKCG